MVVTQAEREAGVLSPNAFDKALDACRQCGFAKLKGVIDKKALKKLSRKGKINESCAALVGVVPESETV